MYLLVYAGNISGKTPPKLKKTVTLVTSEEENSWVAEELGIGLETSQSTLLYLWTFELFECIAYSKYK